MTNTQGDEFLSRISVARARALQLRLALEAVQGKLKGNLEREMLAVTMLNDDVELLLIRILLDADDFLRGIAVSAEKKTKKPAKAAEQQEDAERVLH